MDTKIRLNPVL